MPTNPVTFGVEEQFLLLHPVSGWAQPAAPALLRLLRGQPGMTAELMRYQFETVTPVCTSTGQLHRELTRLRTVAAEGARPPGIWHDATEYDDVVRHLVQRDAAMDERSVYFLARLSPRYPTVEVRVADTCPDTATTVVVAALVGALVVTATEDIRAGVAPPPIPVPVVSSALLAAAENGLDGPGIDPFTGRVVPAWDLLTTLLDRIGKALAALGDAAVVGESLARLRARGTGAARQRRLWAHTTSPPDFVGGLTTMTGAVE
jgi:gamma-glutamyl:cysteine ligase YbdK (ATP-grasp superfamily)